MDIELFELKNLMIDCVEIGYKKAMVELGGIKAHLNQAQAYQKYGRTTVDRWVIEGLITPNKDGGGVRYDRMTLEIISASSNTATYRPTIERNKRLTAVK